MTISETYLIFVNIISLGIGIYVGHNFGFNYGHILGRAKEFVHFTVALEKAFSDKTKEEFSEIVNKVGKEYDLLVKKEKNNDR